MPGRYNARWRELIAGNPNALAKDVYHFGGRLTDEYDLSGMPINAAGASDGVDPAISASTRAAVGGAESLPGFEYAPDEVGHRHQLGGEPTWLQGDATPVCGECGKPMTFYGQLDSINDDIVLADVGLVYVFVCFDDYKSASVIQSM